MNLDPVTLEGDAVRLEPLTESHLAALCEIAFDVDLWRVGVDRITNQLEMRAYIRRALEAQAAGTALPFATVAKNVAKDVAKNAALERLVGSTRYMNIDAKNRRVEIGSTWIAPAWQRTAVNTEAKYLMLKHAFEGLGCVRVELKTDVLNHRSRKAILRLGAKEEGVLRRHVLTWDGRFRDTIYFSILDYEWPEVKANLEKKIKRPQP